MNAVSSRPIHNHFFVNLIKSYQSTAAGRGLSLILCTDAMNGERQEAANFHNDFYSLYIVQRGRGTHVIDNQAFGVARGDVYAMVPGMRHYFEGCHDMKTDTFHFAPTLFDEETRTVLNATPGFQSLFVGEPVSPVEKVLTVGGRWLHLTPTMHTRITEMVEELRTEWTQGDATGTLLARNLFFRLLVQLARANDSFTATVNNPPAPIYNQETTIATALRLMDEGFTESVRVEEIAKAVFLSPDRFTEVFVQGVGRTPRDYLRYLRVERAKSLLRSGKLSMTQVAQESGFGDPAYFARAFRNAVGASPSEWKKSKAAV